MALWNFTSHSPMETFQGVNTLTEGLFGVSIIVLLWMTVFFRQSTESNRDRIVAANFVASITAILFSILGFVNDYVLGAAIVLFVGSIYLLTSKS